MAMNNKAMAAAQGMLNSTSATDQTNKPLTVQIPTINVTPPVESPTYGPTNDNGKRPGCELENKKPAKRVPLDSKAHFASKYITIKDLGHGDNGETAAAIRRSDLVDLIAKHGSDRSADFFADVRAHLVCVKFARPDNVEGDLTGEIQFLSEKFPHQHESINYHLDSHLDGEQQWIVFPFAAHGSVEGFRMKFNTDMSLSMRWHYASCVAGTLLFLFFGVKDADNPPATPPANWPMVTHRDIFDGNTLLDAPIPGDPTGFPRCIVADFGRADDFDRIFYSEEVENSTPAERIPAMRREQSKDINQLANVLMNLLQTYLQGKAPCPHLDEGAVPYKEDDEYISIVEGKEHCARCEYIVNAIDYPEGPEALFQHWIAKLKVFRSTKDDFSDALELLSGLRKVAEKEKKANFEPLSADATKFLGTPFVTDQDLKRALGIFERPIAKPKSVKSRMLAMKARKAAERDGKE